MHFLPKLYSSHVIYHCTIGEQVFEENVIYLCEHTITNMNLLLIRMIFKKSYSIQHSLTLEIGNIKSNNTCVVHTQKSV